jgi:hypothetical protein
MPLAYSCAVPTHVRLHTCTHTRAQLVNLRAHIRMGTRYVYAICVPVLTHTGARPCAGAHAHRRTHAREAPCERRGAGTTPTGAEKLLRMVRDTGSKGGMQSGRTERLEIEQCQSLFPSTPCGQHLTGSESPRSQPADVRSGALTPCAARVCPARARPSTPCEA